MAANKLLTKDELFEDHFSDPEARQRWERTALARGVAHAVLGYRIEHNLSQRALAAKLGIRQSHVARLELGEHNPTLETLGRLAGVLGLRFIVDVAPPGAAAPQLVLPPGVVVVQDATGLEGSRVLVAAG